MQSKQRESDNGNSRSNVVNADGEGQSRGHFFSSSLSAASPSETAAVAARLGAAGLSSWPGQERRHQRLWEGEKEMLLSSECSSPTRVHLRRTGSIDIEHGGRVETPFSSSAVLLSPSRWQGEGGRRGRGGGRADDVSCSLAAATTAVDDVRLAERDRLRGGAGAAPPAATRFELDRGSERQRPGAGFDDGLGGGGSNGSGRTPWSSSLMGGGASAHVGSGGRDEARGSPRGASSWRTEADADLSDIKATMRRIDDAGAASTATAGVAFSLDRGSMGGIRRDDSVPGGSGSGGWARAGGRLSSSFAGGGGDEPARRSAAPPGWGASAGSKAVLSALRALQDKIRKLESERDRASVEAGTLRRQIAALQTENGRTLQVQMAGLQEKSLASRLAYERLHADKLASDVRLRKAEEQQRLLAKEAADAKNKSAVAEEARRTAESRVSTLEGRLLNLRKEDERASSAEAGAADAAARTARSKADQVDVLRKKVARMEASVQAEKTSREEVEQGLSRALSAKGKLERFLEGVLKVNEELVKVKALGGGDAGAHEIGNRNKTQQKKKQRPKAAAGAPAGVGCKGRGGGGGGGRGEEFNVGTHTAKRAFARARKKKAKKTNRSSCASCALAAGAAEVGGEPLSAAAAKPRPHHVAFYRTMLRQSPPAAVPLRQRQHQQQRRVSSSKGGATPAAAGNGGRSRMTRSTAAAAAAVGGWTGGRVGEGRAVPFLATGPCGAAESYNVVSAVSKAVRQARRGRPAESMGELYTEVGHAVLNSTNEVPSMFRERERRRRQQKSSGSKVGVRAGGARVGEGGAFLDVALPDVEGLSSAGSMVSSGSERERESGEDRDKNGYANDEGEGDHDSGDDDGDDDTSASRERWRREWNRATAKTSVEREDLEDDDARGLVTAAREERKERRAGGTGGSISARYMQYGFDTIGRGRGPAEEDDDEEESGYVGSSERFVESVEEEEEEGRGNADEEEQEEGGQEGHSLETGSEQGMDVSGLPVGEGSVSSGDERIWRAAGN